MAASGAVVNPAVVLLFTLADVMSRVRTRSLAVLHVACARELRLRYFLTFDERQVTELSKTQGQWTLQTLAFNRMSRGAAQPLRRLRLLVV